MEEVSKAVKKLAKSGLNKTSVAAFAVVATDGTYSERGQACHGDLRRSNWHLTPDFVVSRVQTGRSDVISNRDIRASYVNWLVNQSPYADAFLVKDVEWLLDHEVFVATANAPADVMAAGLVQSRRLHEYTHIAEITARLIQAGMNGNLANLISYCVQSVEGDNFYWADFGTEHWALSPALMSKEMVERYVNGDTSLADDEPYASSKTFIGNWKKMFGKKESKWLGNECKLIMSSFGKGSAAYVNPFAASKVTQQQSTPEKLSALYEYALEIEARIMEKINVQEHIYSGGQPAIQEYVA